MSLVFWGLWCCLDESCFGWLSSLVFYWRKTALIGLVPRCSINWIKTGFNWFVWPKSLYHLQIWLLGFEALSFSHALWPPNSLYRATISRAVEVVPLSCPHSQLEQIIFKFVWSWLHTCQLAIVFAWRGSSTLYWNPMFWWKNLILTLL